MTAHLTLDELYSLVFDNVAPDAGATAHLATCAACREEASALRQLASDLSIAQASMPTIDALSRYQSLFTYVEQRPSVLRQIAAQMRAVLTWDSRQHVALHGVRSGAATTYRQLYAAGDIEVELMVERSGRGRRVEGDLIADENGGRNESALVELIVHGDQALYTTETDARGIFRFDAVIPGTYRMVVTRAESSAIEIEALEIA